MTRCATWITAMLLAPAATLLWAAAPPVLSTPEVLKAVAPTYPPMAIRAVVIGYVLVDVSVDASGAVTSTHIVRTPVLLDQAALRAARQWRFAPDTASAVRTVRLTFVFDLAEKPQAEEDLYPSFVPPYRVDVRDRCRHGCDTLKEHRASAFMGLK